MAEYAACCTPYIRHFPLVPVQRWSIELPATSVGERRRRCSLRRHKGGPWTVLFYFLPPRFVAGWLLSVTFKVSTYLTKYWSGLHPKLEGRGADSSLSDSCAIAIGISVDTGTLERVANWSPDSVATVDPCDPGTDPRNGSFAGIPHGNTFLTWTSTVTCPRLWLYAATCPTRWPRSGSGHRLLPVGVQRLLFTVVLAVVTFPFVSFLNAD